VNTVKTKRTIKSWKKCASCEALFLTSIFWPKKYCNRSCYEIGRIGKPWTGKRAAIIESKCQFCNKKFNSPEYKKQKFCSISCAEKIPKHIVSKIITSCPYCNKKLQRTKKQKANRDKVYCCRSHYLKHQSILQTGLVRNPKAHFKTKCLYCKKAFKAYQHAGKKTYCSKKCRKVDGNSQISGANHPYHQMAFKERIDWHKARLTKIVKFKGKNGNFLYAHSKWERDMYKILAEAKINFKYSNEDDFKFKLSDGTVWYPDFLLPRKKFIIEVKGWRREKFNKKLKQFKKDYGKNYSVALCEFDPKLFNYKQILPRLNSVIGVF